MSDDGFYVGYLALPRAHKRFLSIAIPLALLGIVIGAAGIAKKQPAWGDGYWQTGGASEFQGTLAFEPYPMLHVAGDDPDHPVTSYLLVEMGKFGAVDRFTEMGKIDGAAVAIRGRELRRNGRKMIEIDPGSRSLGPAISLLDFDEPAVRVIPSVDPDESLFFGEILDSKCDLGAMKPGAGRGHRSCAALCISGGIPPVLVVRAGDEGSAYLLLTDLQGRGLDDSAIARLTPMIGEPVSLKGRSGRVGSWDVLRLDPAQFE